MDCDQGAVTLSAYLDGELTGDQANAVREHIGKCPKCAAELADMVIVRRALRPARGLFTPSAEFRKKIEQQVARPRRRERGWRLVPGIALAAAVLLVVVAGLLYSRRPDGFAEVADRKSVV